MNDDNTKYHVSDGRPLTPAQIGRLDEIEARLGDAEDSPEIPDAAWAAARRGKHASPSGEAISIRLDPDVLAWLRGKDAGYEAEINSILRERMLQES